MNTITTIRAFDVNAISFEEPKSREGNNGRIVYVKYKGGPLRLQTPPMRCMGGIKRWEPMAPGQALKVSADLTFANKDTNVKIAECYDKLQAFDKLMLQAGVDNAAKWLKRKDIDDVSQVKMLYSPFIKPSKDPKYAPSMRLTLPHTQGHITCDTFGPQKEEVNINELETSGATKGAIFTAIIQCAGVWIAGDKFGVSWKVVQLKVQPPANMHGYSFKEDDIDLVSDDEPLPSKIKAPPLPLPLPLPSTRMVETIETTEEEIEDSDDPVDSDSDSDNDYDSLDNRDKKKKNKNTNKHSVVKVVKA